MIVQMISEMGGVATGVVGWLKTFFKTLKVIEKSKNNHALRLR